RRWQQAKAAEGRVVLISGEPGIGKSRLTAEIVRRAEAEPHTRLRYFCAPHHQDSALYPFIVQLERAAGFAREDSEADRLAKLKALLALAARNGQRGSRPWRGSRRRCAPTAGPARTPPRAGDPRWERDGTSAGAAPPAHGCPATLRARRRPDNRAVLRG